jgi:hypothetical protein
MPEPRSTDQLAVNVRDVKRRRGHMASTTMRPTQNLVALLRQELPGISEADIADVLLRTGHWLTIMLPELRRTAGTDTLGGEYAANIVSFAGEQLHTDDHIRRTRPTTSPTG